MLYGHAVRKPARAAGQDGQIERHRAFARMQRCLPRRPVANVPLVDGVADARSPGENAPPALRLSTMRHGTTGVYARSSAASPSALV